MKVELLKPLNKINPKKLLNSKWTAIQPKNKEKHFLISQITFDDLGEVENCKIEAILSKRIESINWIQLKDQSLWIQGWK